VLSARETVCVEEKVLGAGEKVGVAVVGGGGVG
jgi:hypothetical protein